jgi:hypothetical protein
MKSAGNVVQRRAAEGLNLESVQDVVGGQELPVVPEVAHESRDTR